MTTRANTAPCRLAALGLPMSGAVRMAPVCGLPQLLSDHGLDADAVIREQGCDPQLFTDPDNVIAFSAIGRLLAVVAELTGCAYPGLVLGRQGGLEVSGAVGRAVRSAPDLGTALRFLSLNLHLHDRGSVPYVWTDGHLGMFGYTLNCAEIIGSDHIYDGAMAIACNMLRELAGPTWRAKEVRLFRDAPPDLAPFREHFRAPLRFRAEQAAIVFPAADLKRPCIGADPDTFARALSDLESLDAESGTTLADKVHRVLLNLFVTGVACGGATADRIMISRLFALHPRTLNRRLRAEGTSFAALLARARYDIARGLLRDTRLPVHDIAPLLGYAGTAAFTHAFRQWSGTTAARWRESHRAVASEVPFVRGQSR